MQNSIKRQIKRLCQRAIERTQSRDEKRLEYAEKFTKRTGQKAGKAKSPQECVHKHFDPVYCKRNANFLAQTLWRKILLGTYEPLPALKFEIPKFGGGKRQIMQFAFPDAAVASVLNQRLTSRNLKKQSGNSFAYRPDRNVFDAILKVKSAIKQRRNFVLQLDFEKYFDSIPHKYIKELLGLQNYILLSKAERAVIESFLAHRYAVRDAYIQNQFEIRKTGTPQGSSISLTLANLANQPLDCELEEINGQFSRYADDTVVICYSYEDAIHAYQTFLQHCQGSGLKINRRKSPGIRILSDFEEEFSSIPDFKFLGYGIRTSGLFMHLSVEKKLKNTLSRLINIYLIHYIEKHKPNIKRAGIGYDWDLVGLILEIRNILYGGLTEEQIYNFIRKGEKLPRMRGLMGFYALLDNHEALVRLDGWLASNIKQAIYKRYRVMKLSMRISKKQVIDGSWYHANIYSNKTFNPDTTLPSFVRAWAAARKYYFAYGLENGIPPLRAALRKTR